MKCKVICALNGVLSWNASQCTMQDCIDVHRCVMSTFVLSNGVMIRFEMIVGVLSKVFNDF